MRKILAGIETEYGLHIEGRGAENQVEDSMALVRGYPGECLPLWDYRYESPRSDLRGFRVDHLAYDPEDAKYDAGKTYGKTEEVRSDRILPNGARFYNDHGHPEYSTPECWTLQELAAHDHAGMIVVQRAAEAYAMTFGIDVRCYKNNTDFHGASYGTHENYLMPRSLGFQRLFDACVPMMIARQVLTGAGKVGAETGREATYQLSARADFFSEAANPETLYRRPVFNTRDEPHSDPSKWIRLHVICGDANMIPECTARKVGLMKLALHLAESGEAPAWKVRDPVKAFQEISRDESYEFRIELEGSWTNAFEVLESYFAAAEATLEIDEDMRWTIDTSRQLLKDIHGDFGRFQRSVDWAAKLAMLEHYMQEEGSDWRDPSLRAFDLEYHNIDPKDGLWFALEEMGAVAAGPDSSELMARLEGVMEPTRALARGTAVRRFRDSLRNACWHSLTFQAGDSLIEVPLPPERDYPKHLAGETDVESFISMLKGVK